MPFFFYLPFIIATGMFSVATESFSTGSKSQPEKRES